LCDELDGGLGFVGGRVRLDHSSIVWDGRSTVLYDPATMNAPSHNAPARGLFPCQRELLGLLESLVNVIFCAKDLDGRYLEANSAFVRRTGKKSKRDVIGTTAMDHFRPELAERYEEQDQKVFATGAPLHDQLEIIKRPNGQLGWYLTTKLPVSGDDPGTLVGLVSVSRDLNAPSDEHLALERLQDVVTHVKEHLAVPIRVAELAAIAECSEAQLERRFRKVLGVTATQHILRVRVEAAARLLTETDTSIATIATMCGFYDQPDFTRRFARLTNSTPAQFRSAGGTFGVSA
jgi:PAS domain S-box-containing protein